MPELSQFGTIVLVVAIGFSAAVAATKLSDFVPIPGPAIFLLAAAIAGDVSPTLAHALSTRGVERIAVIALLVILFDGGMDVGWRRFRASAVEITALGVAGTFATAALVALFAHSLFGLGWSSAGILGAALAPTDPAVMFSVLGKREIGGRTGTILEGESGANDPVGIALMIGMLAFATHAHASFWTVVREVGVEMSVGLAIGVAGAAALLPLMRRFTLPSVALYPIRTLAFASVIYGLAAVAHGSGFLAVFVAGLLVGDARAPYKGDIKRFHKSLAGLAEIVVFAALGLTMHLEGLSRHNAWLDGLLLAALLAFVVRPAVVTPILAAARLRPGERAFVAFGGLKGAVPILLGTFVLLSGAHDSTQIYDIIFVVVAFSVIVQGTAIPFVAPRLGVQMQTAQRHGTRRFAIGPMSDAAGSTIRSLALGDRAWVEAVLRDGQELKPRGRLALQAGDQVTLVLDVEEEPYIEHLLRGAPAS